MRDNLAHMLEEVELMPAVFGEVVRRTERSALRTRVAGATFARHFQVQLMRLGRGIEMPIHQLPRWLTANTQQQNLIATHAVAPLRNPVPSMAQQVNGFHLG